jgi:hypothetical protein
MRVGGLSLKKAQKSIEARKSFGSLLVPRRKRQGQGKPGGRSERNAVDDKNEKNSILLLI